MIDTMNLAVRLLVRNVLGMPLKSVRPADQIAPTGGQTEPFATVKIISCDGIGSSDYTYEDDGAGGTNEVLQLPQRFVASVNFYGSTAKDPVGIAKYSNEAFDRAARLVQLLEKTSSVILMQQMGLGFLSASPARNLSGLADATWQSRGQIDLTFNVINREMESIGLIESVEIDITTIGPDGIPHTRSSEVTT